MKSAETNVLNKAIYVSVLNRNISKNLSTSPSIIGFLHIARNTNQSIRLKHSIYFVVCVYFYLLIKHGHAPRTTSFEQRWNYLKNSNTYTARIKINAKFGHTNVGGWKTLKTQTMQKLWSKAQFLKATKTTRNKKQIWWSLQKRIERFTCLRRVNVIGNLTVYSYILLPLPLNDKTTVSF